MSGDMLPWFTTFLIGVVVALILLIAVVLLPRVGRTAAMTKRFFCPWARRDVVVQYLTDDRRHPVGIISCTAFADPIVITCERRCLLASEQLAPTAGGPHSEP